jgi:hypothetical protein
MEALIQTGLLLAGLDDFGDAGESLLVPQGRAGAR